MGKVTKIAKSKLTIKRFTMAYTDGKVSIWALSEEDWQSGLWRKISS